MNDVGMKKSLPRALMSERETKEYNRKICELMSILLNIAPDFIDIEAVTEISRDCGVSVEYSYAQTLAAVCGLDTLGRDRKIFTNYFLPMVNRLDDADFVCEPYYKNIEVPDIKLGNWRLGHGTLKAGEAFVCGDFLVPEDGRLIPQIGFFEREYTYPAAFENGREWMTLMPNEIVTTRPAVRDATGRVLTFGLGLGYFAYEASEKESVESVTVVELRRDAAELFNKYILPQFPKREKIKVICGDAFEFADEKMKDGEYDFVFCDIWHDASDGRGLYLRMKEYEKKFPSAKFSYWLEDTINCYLDKELWE